MSARGPLVSPAVAILPDAVEPMTSPAARSPTTWPSGLMTGEPEPPPEELMP